MSLHKPMPSTRAAKVISNDPKSDETRLVFYGVSATLAQILGPNEIMIWAGVFTPEADGRYPAPLGPIDLTKHPGLLRPPEDVQVEVGEPIDSLTTLRGPFPSNGDSYIGMLYCEQRFYDQVIKKQVDDKDGEKYEFTTIYDIASERRYRGFHVKVLDKRNGETLVLFYRAGKSKFERSEEQKGHAPKRPAYWVSDGQIWDGAPSLAVGQQGALFVDVDFLRGITPLEGPKRPPSQGLRMMQGAGDVCL